MAKTLPPQITPPPFCCNCKNFLPEEDDPKFGDVPRCLLSEMIEVVRGTKFYPPCIEMRGHGAPCSMEGKFFQPKTVTVIPPPSEPPKLADN